MTLSGMDREGERKGTTEDMSKVGDDVETGVWYVLRDKAGGHLHGRAPIHYMARRTSSPETLRSIPATASTN